MIECNIDDMNSEFYEYIMKKLFDEGALDVFLTNIIMKKNRPAIKLSVISRHEDVDKLSRLILKETSTIGVRKYAVERDTLSRKMVSVDTRFGPIDAKIAYRDGEIVNCSPEYESVKRAAERTGAPMKIVYGEAWGSGIEGFYSKEEKRFDKTGDNN